MKAVAADSEYFATPPTTRVLEFAANADLARRSTSRVTALAFNAKHHCMISTLRGIMKCGIVCEYGKVVIELAWLVIKGGPG
jgi:hypothetical protein